MRPSPDRYLRRGSCRRGSSEREPGCRSTAKPGGMKPHEAVAPRCTMCRDRTKVKPTVAPPKRAARDPNAQRPLQAAAPATQPTATKSTTSAVIIDDATAALWPPEGGSSTCGRCWSEDHRTLGATSPKKGRGNRTADGRRPRRTASVEPTPGCDRTGHPKVDRAADRHAPKEGCAPG